MDVMYSLQCTTFIFYDKLTMYISPQLHTYEILSHSNPCMKKNYIHAHLNEKFNLTHQEPENVTFI